MLNSLPNENLVKILAKAKVSTRRNCRVLNQHFNNIILNHRLHKQDLQLLSIGHVITNSYNQPLPDPYFRISLGEKKEKTFTNYDEFMDFLTSLVENVGKIERLVLFRLDINTDLLNILLNRIHISDIRELNVYGGSVEKKNVPAWFYLSQKLNLNKFTIEKRRNETKISVPVPPMMLNHARNNFECRNLDVFEIGNPAKQMFGLLSGPFSPNIIQGMHWLNDQMLSRWYSPSNSLDVSGCFTGLTIQGVIECVKKMISVTNLHKDFHFGILSSETLLSVETALNEKEAEWNIVGEWDEIIYSYQIYGIGGNRFDRRNVKFALIYQ